MDYNQFNVNMDEISSENFRIKNNWFNEASQCSRQERNKLQNYAYTSNKFLNRAPYPNKKENERRVYKRRGRSPKIYPHKVLVTEDKVASSLDNLYISAQPKFQRTFNEIEESIVLDSDDDVDNIHDVSVKLAKYFQEELTKFKRDIFIKKNTQLNLSLFPEPHSSNALVIWKPSVNTEEFLQRISKNKDDCETNKGNMNSGKKLETSDINNLQINDISASMEI